MSRKLDFSLTSVSVSSVTWYLTVLLGWPLIGIALYQGYRGISKEFAGGHETVRHSTHEYARGDVHTNSIEGFFGMIRRGLDGIYHSVSHKHLHRYLSEFQFQHDHRELSDGERARRAIQSANHKRLMYKEVLGG